jgi:PilZ domain
MNRSAMANQLDSGFSRIQLPIAPHRRSLDRVLTNLPIRIVSIDGERTYYPGICTNLSRGGIGFETSARLKVGEVVEFDFVQVVDEAMSDTSAFCFEASSATAAMG